MPQPDVRDVHVDAILTNFSLAYKNLDYISDQIFPQVSVQKQSDKYFKYDKSNWFRDSAKLRAPATESFGSGWTLSTDSYFCDNFAFHVDIADEVRENADQPLRPDQEAAEFVADRLAMQRERAWVNSFFKTGVWTATGSDATPSVVWSTYGTSDPIVDIETQMNNMRITTGKRPNTIVMGAAVWSSLKNHPDFIDRIKYTQKGMVTQDLFSSLVDIPNVLIGQAIYDSADEGAASSFADIWGKSALLLYVAPFAGARTVTAGVTFTWSRFGGGALQYLRRLRLDKTMADRVEGLSYYDQKVVAADLGNFMNGVVA